MRRQDPKVEITRKEALQRMGKYAALTAIGTFVILTPAKAQQNSTPKDPGGPPFEDI